MRRNGTFFTLSLSLSRRGYRVRLATTTTTTVSCYACLSLSLSLALALALWSSCFSLFLFYFFFSLARDSTIKLRFYFKVRHPPNHRNHSSCHAGFGGGATFRVDFASCLAQSARSLHPRHHARLIFVPGRPVRSG